VLIESRSAFMPYAPSAHPEPELRAWVQNTLLSAGGVTVATLNGAVVGVLAVSRQGGSSWINQMWVTPSLVGKGIGSHLLRHALTILEPPIRLYTFQANSGARRFYERKGFQAIEFADGQSNEERCPDVLFELQFVVSESGGSQETPSKLQNRIDDDHCRHEHGRQGPLS